MELTPLFFYLGALVLRQVKCDSPCSVETETLVRVFLDELSTMELYDSRLYTPRLSNYGQNCSRSTLRCFEKEMTVLVRETEQNLTSRKGRLLKGLKNLARSLRDKMPLCPQCEVYTEEKPETFLNTLLRILQIICSISNTMTKSESNR